MCLLSPCPFLPMSSNQRSDDAKAAVCCVESPPFSPLWPGVFPLLRLLLYTPTTTPSATRAEAFGDLASVGQIPVEQLASKRVRPVTWILLEFPT